MADATAPSTGASTTVTSTPSRRVLLVTADDLGYAPERDAGIIYGFEHGAISQASLLVTGPSAASAVVLAKVARRIRHEESSGSTPCPGHGLPLGLHFNLTEGTALSAAREFPGKAGLWNEARAAPEGARDSVLDASFVLGELRAQLDRFVALVGEQPGYVDGHNHVHVLPTVAQAFLELLPPRGIRWARLPLEQLDPSPVDGAGDNAAVDSLRTVLPATQRAFFEEIMQHAKAARALWSSPADARLRLGVSDHFIGLQLMGRNNSAEKLAHYVRNLRPGVTEFMCHPGYPSTIGDEFSRSDERAHELELLCDPALMRLLDSEQVRLGAWIDLE